MRPVRRSGLRDEVYQTIGEMLIENRLPPGSPLRVEALSEMLDVSPTPVREALVQLETTGLVDYVANRGYSVAPLPSAEDMRLIMDARLVLELAAAERAAEREDRRFAAELGELIDGQRAAGARIVGDGSDADRAAIREYLRLDHAFHDTIFREAGNPYLARLARSMDAQSQRARQSFLHGVDDASDAATEHEQIRKAIVDGDAPAAVSASRAHLERVLAKALSQF